MLGVTDIAVTIIIIIIIIMQRGGRGDYAGIMTTASGKRRCLSEDSTKVLVNIKTFFKFKAGPPAMYLKT